MVFPIREQMVSGLRSEVIQSNEGKTDEMLPHDLAMDLGIATRSSLQTGTISTE